MNKINTSIVFCFLISIMISTLSVSGQGAKSFKPGELWQDNKGVHINAHGGGFLFANGKYYWFGEHKIEGEAGNIAMVGVRCYSSKDLYNWKNEGIALPVEKNGSGSPIEMGCILERPKVIYNKKTRKYVMWFHLELKGQEYKAAQTGVAVSNNVAGPYKFIKSVRANVRSWPQNMNDSSRQSTVGKKDLKPWSEEWKAAVENGLFVRRDFEKGQMSRDMTLFVDDDGKAYHIHSAEDNQTLHISELTDDYTSFTGKYVRVFPGDQNEAPAIFKKNGKYYMVTSGCTGWAPNEARSAVANSMMGPWKQNGNPCTGNNAPLTFNSQSTYIIPLQGKKNAFIFVADRWEPNNAIDGRYVFLPIEFTNEDKIIIRWRDEWDLLYFNESK